MFHANVLGRLLRAILPVPVVISTIHSARETPRRSQRFWPRALAYRATSPLADRTVSVLDGIWTGVDVETFHPPAGPPSNDRFTWLSVGRLMWKKDYPTLLRAMSGLPEARLLLVGEGPDEPALRAQAPPNVEFAGLRDDVPELMRSVDGFVLSSVIEGLPVAMLEAMATGLPVVATDVGGIARVGPARTVPPGDSQALSAAMREVMRSRPDPAATRARAVERYGWPVVTDRWRELYRELGR
jgi:glycosyltransferase involved in cell wall biosynthesis